MAETRDKPTRLTKTIPLSGGVQHDVEEFVQDAPTMTAQDNVRYRKQGEVEKTEPRVLTTTPPFSSNTIAGMGVRGDKLFCVAPDGEVAEYDAINDDWDTADGRLRPSVNETLFQSNPVPGAHAYCFGEGVALDATPFRVIAFEVRKHNNTVGGNLPDVDVHVEVYNTDNGRLIDKETYANMSSPQIADCGSGPIVFFANTTGDIRKAQFSKNLKTLPSQISVGINNGPAHPDSMKYDRYAATTVARDTYRLGLCEDGGRGASYVVAGDGVSGFLAFTTHAGDSTYVTNLTSSGTQSGTEVGMFPTGELVVGLAVDGANNRVAILTNLHGAIPTTPTYTLEGTILDITTSTPAIVGTTQALSGSATGHIINGSVVLNGATAYYMSTIVNRDVTEPTPTAISEDVSLVSGSFTSSSSPSPGTLFNLRLASQLVVVPNEARMAAVVEQWTAMEPASITTGLVTCPVAIRGKTAILIDVAPGSSNYKIRSAFDAGQSLTVNASSAEQYLHTNTLTLVGGNFRYINRVLLQPEDITYATNAIDATYSKGHGSWHAGEWRSTVYEVTQPTSLISERIGQAAVLNSSIAAHYAGDVLVELSPLEQPEIVFFQNNGGFGPTRVGYELPPGAQADDTRTVQVIVGYTDKNGQLHRSPPSFPLFVDAASTGGVDASTDGNNAWRHIGITLPLSGFGTQRDYFAEVYVGQASGSPQLAGSWPIPMGLQTPSYAEFTFMDSLVSPLNINPLRSSEVIYTEGNVLPADAWPDFKHMVVTSNRLWGVSRNVPGVLYYSKLFEPNIGPEFSAALIIDLGQNRLLNAIGAIDDKVIVFTDTEIFAVYDTGPDNTGANGDFIVDRLTSPFGCSDPESVVQIPDGLLFHSDVSGEIHLITRDLQVLDIGKPVMDFTEQSGFNVVASMVYPAQHEARFYIDVNAATEYGPDPDTGTGIKARPARPKFTNVCSTSDCLVYNYHYQKWSRRTGDAAQHAVLHDNKPVTALNIGLVYFTTTSWANSELLRAETPWIRNGQLQTFGRIDELAILGRYLSSWVDNGTGIESGDLQVTLRYDYEGYAPSEDVYLFRANAGDLGTESADRMQITIHPGRPKCQAIKVIIEEVATSPIEVSEPTYAAGQGFALSGLDLIYTPKSGSGGKTLPKGRRK